MWNLWEASNGKFSVVCEISGNGKASWWISVTSGGVVWRRGNGERFLLFGGWDESGGCKAACDSKSKNWVGDVQEILRVYELKRFSLKMKGIVYRSCVRSVMLYGSETWCFREKEITILSKTERAKLMEKKRTEDLMEMLGLKETMVQMPKTNGVRWYRHVLRRDDGHVLRKALEFEVKCKRKRKRPKKT